MSNSLTEKFLTFFTLLQQDDNHGDSFVTILNGSRVKSPKRMFEDAAKAWLRAYLKDAGLLTEDTRISAMSGGPAVKSTVYCQTSWFEIWIEGDNKEMIMCRSYNPETKQSGPNIWVLYSCIPNLRTTLFNLMGQPR